MRVAILGRTSMLYGAIGLLEQAGHEIALIGTSKESPEYKVTAADFKKEAEKRDILFFNSSKINSPDIIQMLKEAKADIAISMNWLTLIGEEAIDCFSHGILNAHPGDLPRYRGNACPNWAIIQDEHKIGITIHYMDAFKLDAGDIVLKEYIDIDKETQIGDIYTELEKRIPQMFVEAVNLIETGSGNLQKQSEKGLRCYPRKPVDARIDWTRSCGEISRLVRASGLPFSGAYTYMENEKIFIHKISFEEYWEESLVVPGQVVKIDRTKDHIGVAAADGIVIIEDGYVESRPHDKLTNIIYSTRMRMGYSLEDEIYALKKAIQSLEKMISKE